MRKSLGNSFNPKHKNARLRETSRGFAAVICAALIIGAAFGCESLQRKFTRKSKRPVERPTPVIDFQDYSAAMTPLDRYRKHYLIYDYWSGELVDSLGERQPNGKRIRRASAESLAELRQLERLLHPDAALRLSLLIKSQASLDKRLQSGSYQKGEVSSLRRTMQQQKRKVRREFFWRHVEDLVTGGTPYAEEGY